MKDGDIDWTIDHWHGSYWWEVWQWGVTETHSYYFRRKFSGRTITRFWARHKVRKMVRRLRRGEWT